MITEKDLDEAIAECQGQRSPNASTCIKLAAYYILRDHLFPMSQDISEGHSHSAGLFSPSPVYDSGTEFSDSIQGLSLDDILPVIDELMEALKVLNPKLYDGVLRRLRDR